jgi:hypothetical protein
MSPPWVAVVAERQACSHTLEVPAVGVEHHGLLTTEWDTIMVTVHVCGEDSGHDGRHVCRKCGWWWAAHDHDPFAGEDEHAEG